MADKKQTYDVVLYRRVTESYGARVEATCRAEAIDLVEAQSRLDGDGWQADEVNEEWTGHATEVPSGWTRASDRGEVCCECHAEVKAGERIYVNLRGRVFCDYAACGPTMAREEG